MIFPSQYDDLAALAALDTGLGSAAPTGLPTLGGFVPQGPGSQFPPGLEPLVATDLGPPPADGTPPLTAPSAATAPAASPSQPPGPGPQRVGASESFAGTDLDQLARVQSFTRPGDDAAERKAARTADAGLAADVAVQAAARDEQAGALLGEADVRSKIADAQLQGERMAGDFMREQGQEEAILSAAAAEQVAKAEGQYRQQLTAVAGMQVLRDRWYRDKGTAGKVAAWGAALAAGILDAKGVKNSILPQMNAEIDRDINEQLANIDNARKTTEGFQVLYQMARQTSADEAGIRDRIRGFYLEDLKSRVREETMRYGSDLAKTQGEVAVAALDKELANNIVNLRQVHEGNMRREIDQYLTKRGQNFAAAAQRRAYELDLAKFNADEARKNAPEAAKPELQVPVLQFVPDGEGGWLTKQTSFASANTKEEADKLRLKIAGTTNFIQKVRDYRELAKDVGPVYDGYSSDTLNKMGLSGDAKAQQMLAARNELLAEYIHATTGAVANAAEIERAKTQFPLNTWTSAASGQDVLDDKIIQAVNQTGASFAAQTNRPDAGQEYGGQLIAEIRAKRGSAAEKAKFDASPTGRAVKAALPAHLQDENQRGHQQVVYSDAELAKRVPDARSRERDFATVENLPESFRTFLQEEGIDIEGKKVDVKQVRAMAELQDRMFKPAKKGEKFVQPTAVQLADINAAFDTIGTKAADPIVRAYGEYLSGGQKVHRAQEEADLRALQQESTRGAPQLGGY